MSLVTVATWARLAILPGNHQGKRTVRPTPQQSCSHHCLGNAKIIVRQNKRSLDDCSVLMNYVPHVRWASVSEPHTTRGQAVTPHCQRQTVVYWVYSLLTIVFHFIVNKTCVQYLQIITVTSLTGSIWWIPQQQATTATNETRKEGLKSYADMTIHM